jgi:hypothetical protein
LPDISLSNFDFYFGKQLIDRKFCDEKYFWKAFSNNIDYYWKNLKREYTNLQLDSNPLPSLNTLQSPTSTNSESSESSENIDNI